MTHYEILKKQREKASKPLKLVKVKKDFIENFIDNNKTNVMKILFYIAKSNRKLNDFISIKGDMRVIQIDAKKMAEACNIDFRELKRYTKKLTSTSITIQETKDVLEYKSLIPSAIFKNHILEIEMYDVILKKLLEVEKKYALIDINNLMDLRSKHSIRMIQLLEMINRYDKDIPKRRHFDLEEINLFFGTKYKNCSLFRSKVLNVVQKELDTKSHLSFIYTVRQISTAGRPKDIGFIIDLKEIDRDSIYLDQEINVHTYDLNDNIQNLYFKIKNLYSTCDGNFIEFENDKYFFTVNLHDNNIKDFIREYSKKPFDIFIDNLYCIV
jgi:hypothetical protein